MSGFSLSGRHIWTRMDLLRLHERPGIRQGTFVVIGLWLLDINPLNVGSGYINRLVIEMLVLYKRDITALIMYRSYVVFFLNPVFLFHKKGILESQNWYIQQAMFIINTYIFVGWVHATFQNLPLIGFKFSDDKVNSSPTGQDGRHFGRRHFQKHFLKWKC